MFHRLSFSAFAVLLLAVLVGLAALFSSSLSSPGTAHASHGSRPTISVMSITPEVGEEGRYVRVTLQLSRPLTDDEKYCYNAVPAGHDNHRKDVVCMEGGVKIRDNYNDHLNDENHNPADNDWRFVFYGSQVEDRISVKIEEDECITPDRRLEIWIDTAYLDRDEYPNETKYGYDIDTTSHFVRVIGNDDDDAPEDLWPKFDSNIHDKDSEETCAAVVDGSKEAGNYNRGPFFGKNDKSISVDENTAAGVNIGTPITADDPDEDDTLIYSLTGTDAAHFDIDSSTGQIETLGALNHETKTTYRVAVEVTDGKDILGDPDSAIDDSIDVTINVDDVNEAPVFADDAPTDLNIAENTPASENIGDPVTATDPEGGTVSYELDDGDGASFNIESSGQITTKGALDVATQASYDVTVTASDDSGEEATHTVTITVTEANDPPAFDEEIPQDYTYISRSVAENSEAGQPVGDPVSATDEESDALTYSLTSTDADADSFEIDSSGQIKTKAAFDFETDAKTQYLVTVSVHDGKDDAGNTEQMPTVDATIDVTIDVTDVNEGPAFADDAPTDQSVAENTAPDVDIGSPYTATDPDAGETLTYSLGGTDAASFAIDTATGQIKTKDALDYEAKDSYIVTVSVSDGKDAEGNTDTAVDTTHSVAISVTNVDEDGAITFSPEQPSLNTRLTATVEDPDGNVSGQTWVWEISDEGQANWTTISGADTKSYTPVTGDVGKQLRVTATYTDGEGSGKTAQEETGAVTDAPHTNSKPTFAAETDTRSVLENTDAGENIGDPVAATDDSAGTLVYSLGGTDAASFDFDTNTGQLKTKVDLDYESGTTSYTVTISVSDGMDDYSKADSAEDDTIEVTINVTEVNEPPRLCG